MNLHHVDPCLPCYVLDHCNGATEELVGVYVDSSTRYHEVKTALLDTLASHCDKIAEAGKEQAARAAIEEAFRGVHPFKVFDRRLPSRAECGEAFDVPQAWFSFSWES
jgi:hypothetical protein